MPKFFVPSFLSIIFTLDFILISKTNPYLQTISDTEKLEGIGAFLSIFYSSLCAYYHHLNNKSKTRKKFKIQNRLGVVQKSALGKFRPHQSETSKNLLR